MMLPTIGPWWRAVLEDWRLYLDECVEDDVLTGLRNAGVDADSARSQDRLSGSDASQLLFAAQQGRTLLTFDPDFMAESAALLARGEHHSGIIMALARLSIGEKITGVLRSLKQWTPNQLRDQIRWMVRL
ncbi:MAG TPA: DUF5615 family PIN-like protein [Longimicrobium sp.]|nr:DUF5615 family PIN-like protein [Longimicrobium sp.]